MQAVVEDVARHCPSSPLDPAIKILTPFHFHVTFCGLIQDGLTFQGIRDVSTYITSLCTYIFYYIFSDAVSCMIRQTARPN